ncbi:MAG: hypothetical protein ACYSTT_24850 [Planctomycetota bacterium]|jgi:hypothetical protein
MSKWLKIMFILSVVLNIALVVGVIWARSYIGTQLAESAAIAAEAEGSIARHILAELESDEPERIEAVKKMLQHNIENAKIAADMWRQAAEK